MLANIVGIVPAHKRLKHPARQNGAVWLDNTDCHGSHVRTAQMVRRPRIPVKYQLNGYGQYSNVKYLRLIATTPQQLGPRLDIY